MQVHNNELYHYGILGMRWGRRKGPSMREIRADRTNIYKRELKKSIKKHEVYNAKTDTDMIKLEDKARTEAYKKTTEMILKKYGQNTLNKLDK